MRLQEVEFPDAKPIDGYGPGFFRVGGEAMQAPLCVAVSGVRSCGPMPI